MNVKVENKATREVKDLDGKAQKVLDVIPAEHLRGFTKLVFVDLITEPRLSASQRASLPGLYHPRMGGLSAWGEVALSVLFPRKKFPQNLMARLSLKSNIAQAVLYLVAQHYHLTLARGIKKTQLEVACRAYVEKYYKEWRNQQGGWRVKLLKPIQPRLDKWAKKLASRYKEEMERKRLQEK